MKIMKRNASFLKELLFKKKDYKTKIASDDATLVTRPVETLAEMSQHPVKRRNSESFKALSHSF